MNKTPVTIRIQSTQTLEDGTSENFPTQAEGYLYQKDGAKYLSYSESQDSGEADIQTTWKIEQNAATLIRSGNTKLRFRFENGTEDFSMLVTPHGNLPVEIETLLLQTDMDETAGRLRVSYHMKLGGVTTRMDLAIDVQPLA